jgi:uncharacterized protein RhaS with RHS repeats
MRNRYYDPRTGQFTQQDPIGLAGGLNTYGFANGDPVSYSDPYGLLAEAGETAGCPPCFVIARAVMVRAAPYVPRAVALAGAATAVVPSSLRLARNLNASGATQHAGHAAHHIVAGTARAAAPARAVLSRYGVNVNEAVNGVFLPANRAAQAASGGAYHRTLHTNEYYRNVSNILQAAQSREDVVAGLQTISTMLQNNTFPR